MQRYSVATLKEPEFLNITPYNPLISKCEIKVLYTGNNDNHTNIEKDTATRMANSLPGSPIVGAYIQSKEDFGDHGDVITIEDGQIKTSCKTVPYGFVAPDSKVWFKEYKEENRKGEIVTREYLMCEGYLWTGQFPEAQRVIDEGNGQSMELDKKHLKGTWTKDDNSKIEFFIINDAIFSKLCILGEDVEPCFEGASITAPDISKKYNLDEEFTTTLYTMMKELKFSLQGGQIMENDTTVTTQTETPVVEQPTDSFAKKDEEDKDKNTKDDNKDTEDSKKDKKDDDKDKKEKEDYACGGKDKEEKKKYSLEDVIEYQELLEKYQNLEKEFSALKEENKTLSQFKLETEKKQKEQMIENEFYMLSDEDKKDVIDNIDKYSLDEIEGKLSIICVRNKVDFSLDRDSKNESNLEKQLTYSLESETSNLPAWAKAVVDRRKDN